MKKDINTKNVFAEGLSFYKIFIFFLLGSIFGSVFEEIVHFFQHGDWTHREDLIYGPFSTLYGFGVVLYLIFFIKNNDKRGVVKTFLYCSLLGGITEFLTSFFLDIFLHVKFWDYSNMFLQIQGRTTIPIMLIWGLFGTLLLKVVYPFLSKWIEKIPYKVGKPICIFLLGFILLDMFISYGAYFRMLARNKGGAPKTIIEELYDKIYNDEFMYEHFPILKGD